MKGLAQALSVDVVPQLKKPDTITGIRLIYPFGDVIL